MAGKNKEQKEMSTDDAIILMLLDLVEKDGIELELTLTIKGATVSGTLISATDYYEGVTDAAKQNQDKTMAKIIAKKFNDLKEEYAKQKSEEAEEESTPLTFIHLKDAFISGQQPPTSSTQAGQWWRGRIAAIDSFTVHLLG
ncbi:gas vesicle accessory protein GvpU [Bacillus weihaiensis]|uniref:Gas vesicle protein GvpU n=1 Tax=Bacillus weihaiensis TaxID=1547283 RepID=A0A1L3MTP4_9BACI|nr:gas vesicle accessory protein GvpU [Bacillus weihaiensis]APH05711.1 hypothetical protein A9C19_13765 [Bacillus weihaiensis]